MEWIVYDNRPSLRSQPNPLVVRVLGEDQYFFLGAEFENWCIETLMEGVQFKWVGLALDLYFALESDRTLTKLKWL